MIREAISSSNVVSIGYDALNEMLEIQFKADRHGTSKVYAYDDVPGETAVDIMNAGSVGSAVSRFTRAHRGRVVATIDADGIETPVEVPT